MAEKPSLSGSISEILSVLCSLPTCSHALPPPPLIIQHRSRRAALDVHEWEGTFKGQPASFKMTSVASPTALPCYFPFPSF